MAGDGLTTKILLWDQFQRDYVIRQKRKFNAGLLPANANLIMATVRSRVSFDATKWLFCRLLHDFFFVCGVSFLLLLLFQFVLSSFIDVHILLLVFVFFVVITCCCCWRC